MNTDDLERLELYLADALDEHERRELEERLASDVTLSALLEDVRDATELASRLRDTRVPATESLAPTIEGYDIHREIHRGGQGVVYSATQRSTGRRVAVKVLLDARTSSRKQLQRLEREIELAASVSHPGVVTVFDRATTDDHRPALVMELIDGRPLDIFVRDEQLGVRDILLLISQIAEIVSAAHQRGVLHRDLKPSNILIDSERRPRVLDFGLAKALEPDAARSLVTQEGEFMGTLAYAAPEQVERGAIAADVRSDVYALGAMLAEALTGELPLDVSGPIASAIERIRNTPPTRPSALRPGLDPDIDTITLTAMAKEPARRYQSAAAFAADLARYLADEPILAREDSAIYQLRKFAKRHRALVTAACIVLFALLTVTGVVSVALVRTNAANARAELARQGAQVEADKQGRMNAFLRRMLTAVEPGNAGPDLSVVELLESVEDRIESEFADYPDLRAQLHSTMGQTYWRLGQPEPAARHERLAIDLLESLGDKAPPGDLPAALSALGSIEQTLGRLEQSEALHRRAVHLWEQTDLPDDARRHRARINLAALMSATGRADEAERLYRAVLEDLTDPDDESRILRAQTLVSLGALLHPLERHADAMNAYDEALPILRQLRGDEHPDTLACLTNSAEVLVSLGEHDRAERIMQEMIETRGRVFGPRHERVAIAINNLADFYRAQDRPEEAIPLFERARSIFAEALGERHYRVAMVAHNLGLTLTRTGRAHDAIDHLRLAEEIMAQTVPDTHWILAQMRLSLGECLHALDRDAEARPLVTQAHDRLLAHFGPDHSRTLEARRLAGVLDESDTPAP